MKQSREHDINCLRSKKCVKTDEVVLNVYEGPTVFSIFILPVPINEAINKTIYFCSNPTPTNALRVLCICVYTVLIPIHITHALQTPFLRRKSLFQKLQGYKMTQRIAFTSKVPIYVHSTHNFKTCTPIYCTRLRIVIIVFYYYFRFVSHQNSTGTTYKRHPSHASFILVYIGTCYVFVHI